MLGFRGLGSLRDANAVVHVEESYDGGRYDGEDLPVLLHSEVEMPWRQDLTSAPEGVVKDGRGAGGEGEGVEIVDEEVACHGN